MDSIFLSAFGPKDRRDSWPQGIWALTAETLLPLVQTSEALSPGARIHTVLCAEDGIYSSATVWFSTGRQYETITHRAGRLIGCFPVDFWPDQTEVGKPLTSLTQIYTLHPDQIYTHTEIYIINIHAHTHPEIYIINIHTHTHTQIYTQSQIYIHAHSSPSPFLCFPGSRCVCSLPPGLRPRLSGRLPRDQSRPGGRRPPLPHLYGDRA